MADTRKIPSIEEVWEAGEESSLKGWDRFSLVFPNHIKHALGFGGVLTSLAALAGLFLAFDRSQYEFLIALPVAIVCLVSFNAYKTTLVLDAAAGKAIFRWEFFGWHDQSDLFQFVDVASFSVPWTVGWQHEDQRPNVLYAHLKNKRLVVLTHTDDLDVSTEVCENRINLLLDYLDSTSIYPQDFE